MSKKILIATLGTTPAVITEAIDLLAAEKIRLDGIRLLMTGDPEVKQGFDLLAEHLPSHDNLTWLDPIFVKSYSDVDTPEAAVEFMQEACRILKTHRDDGHDVFVSIAGGRKVMSALLALAVQFYGAKRLFHIWVPPWIEEEGAIDKLNNLRSYPHKLIEKLHPSLERPDHERPRIVNLPFIGLFPFLPEILVGLQGGDISTELKDLLDANGLLSKGEPTPLGRMLTAILEGVEALPPARQEECKIHIANHHHTKKLEEFSRMLRDGFIWIKEIRSIEWNTTERIKTHSGNLIDIQLRLHTEAAVGLQLVTTAKGKGQLEAAKKAIESFVQQRR